MNNSTAHALTYTAINNVCSNSLLWTQDTIHNKKIQFSICIVAAINHLFFWLQIIFCSSLRKKSLHWIYGYMVTDILLLTRFFFSYIIHTVSAKCETNISWVLFNCYFEATADSYFNILEPYILLALNICRHIQIAYNRNVYEANPKLLVFCHALIYLVPPIVYTIQFFCGWVQVDGLISNNCDMFYANIYVQVFNVSFGYVFPISLNILVILATLRHINLTAALKRSQHRSTSRDKYRRSLTIQFLCFYLIWLALWSPYVITDQVTTVSSNMIDTVTLISLIETTLDPVIISALDLHFLRAWKTAWVRVKEYLSCNKRHRRRIQPATMHVHAIQPKY